MDVRIKSFDSLKLFAIFLVLWGHCIQCFTTEDFVNQPMYVYIYSFHMPLFMMISGYFASSAMCLPPIPFLKKKIIQLLLPWLTWGILMVGLVFFSRLSRGETLSFMDIVSLMMNNYFWFLKSLFLCCLIVYFGKKLIHNTFWFVAITIAFTHVANYYSLPIMYPCFLIGIYLKSVDSLWQKKSLVLFIISLFVFICLLCFWNKSFWDYKILNPLFIFTEQYNYSLIDLYREAYRVLIGLAGSLSFIFLFYFLFNKTQKSKIFNVCCEWGSYTLGIYILHTIIIEMIMSKFINLDNMGFVCFNFVITPLISFCVLIICVLVIKVINISRIFSFFLLGKS